MKASEPIENIPHTHFTEEEHRAANIGARMFAAKFDASDNPYHYQQHQDLHEAWWRGFNWANQLTKYSKQISAVSQALHVIT